MVINERGKLIGFNKRMELFRKEFRKNNIHNENLDESRKRSLLLANYADCLLNEMGLLNRRYTRKGVVGVVKVINIKMRNKLVCATCLPEGDEKGSFKIVVDVDTAQIIKNSSKKDSVYASMAAYKLSQLRENLPEETVVMWC